MYKKKKNNKYIVISVGIVLVILITISLLWQKNSNDNNILKNISMTVDKIVMFPFTSLNGEKNVTQTESYKIQKNKNKDLEKEVEELRKALELNKSLTEYTPINATVLSRNRSYWFNTITIDKGSRTGINENMAVITSNGLIGKINRVSKNSSEVKLITSNDINFKVSVAIKVNGQDYFGILNGYDKNTGLVTVTGLDKSDPINVGDVVVTSGLGEMFPSGIIIGNVENIITDKFNLSKTLYIRTQQDFRSIHYVTVLKVNE